MHGLSLILFALLATYFVNAQYKNEYFCQNGKCITCVGRYCTTTCKGDGCAKCPIGDCCDGVKCNICRGSNCCSDTKCNTCITDCFEGCKGKPECHSNCFKACLQNEGEYNEDGIINNFSAYEPKNITTYINITNLIDNNQTIYHPIIINSTKSENHNIVLSENTDSNGTKCCTIVHPEICRHDYPNVCYTKRHEECSKICSISSHIHIVKSRKEVKECITISVEPFFYCNNYLMKDCEQCYKSLDDYQVCPSECKSSIIDEKFYNKLYRKD